MMEHGETPVVLERRAVEEFMLNGGRARELVAIGFAVPVGASPVKSYLWFELPNVADEPGKFEVRSADMHHILQALSLSRRDYNTAERVLWHSHYIAVEPSIVDIAEFPYGIVQSGMVFHAPSRTTTLYNGAGIIHAYARDESQFVTAGE